MQILHLSDVHFGIEKDSETCETEIAFPKNQAEANKFLKVERFKKLNNRFKQYIKFCSDLGIPAYTIGNHKSYLVGIREIDGIRFICLNTAWYAKDDEVKKQMWVGANFWEIIKNDISLL